MFSVVDPNLIIGICVAVGTIALAIATFSIVKQSTAQLKELRHQNLLTSSKNEPLLKITDFKFVENHSRCIITNVGEGVAMHLGITTSFTPALGSHPDIFAKFELDGKPVRTTELVNFPSDKKMLILNHKESGVLVTDTKFGLGQKFKIDKKEITMTRQAFTFERLKEYLNKYDISSIAVDIGVIGKDFVESPTLVTRITTFFVNLEKHNSLQDAYEESLKKGDRPYFLSLSQDEIEWTDASMYRNMRTVKKSEF